MNDSLIESLNLQMTALVLVILGLCFLGIFGYVFRHPSTEVWGLATDENDKPMRALVVVFLDGVAIVSSPSEEHGETTEWCSPGDYNYKLTIPWEIVEPPQTGRCPVTMLPHLRPGEVWSTTTTDGKHTIWVQNLGDSTIEIVSDSSGRQIAQTNPLTPWCAPIALVALVLIVIVVIVVAVRPDWQTIKDQIAPQRHTSRIGKLPSQIADFRQNLDASFNERELRDLFFDLRIDYEGLPGESKSDKARELIAYCQRHDCIQELLTRCTELRPKVNWKNILFG